MSGFAFSAAGQIHFEKAFCMVSTWYEGNGVVAYIAEINSTRNVSALSHHSRKPKAIGV